MKKPTICRYCGGIIRLVPAADVYGSSTERLGMQNEYLYQCQNCNARVGCHKGTTRPLGDVANEFRGSLAFMFVIGIASPLLRYRDMKQSGYINNLDNGFFMCALFIGIILAVFCSLFIGTEHNDGTIRNKIIVGQKRETIYLSNMVTCSIIAITMCIVFFVPYLSVGIPLLGFFVADMKMIVMIGITVLVLSVTFASLFTLVAMLSQNKAIIAVACILFSFGLLFAGAMCNRMLDAPKTIPAYSIGENGENTAQEMENPKYLDGTKREIVQFIYDVNPGGQAIQCSTMQVVNLTRLPIYSLVIVILTTGAGVWIFKKKDLK